MQIVHHRKTRFLYLYQKTRVRIRKPGFVSEKLGFVSGHRCSDAESRYFQSSLQGLAFPLSSPGQPLGTASTRVAPRKTFYLWDDLISSSALPFESGKTETVNRCASESYIDAPVLPLIEVTTGAIGEYPCTVREFSPCAN